MTGLIMINKSPYNTSITSGQVVEVNIITVQIIIIGGKIKNLEYATFLKKANFLGGRGLKYKIAQDTRVKTIQKLSLSGQNLHFYWKPTKLNFYGSFIMPRKQD